MSREPVVLHGELVFWCSKDGNVMPLKLPVTKRSYDFGTVRLFRIGYSIVNLESQIKEPRRRKVVP